ncbi:MAG: aldo/keto reductase [Candidatus Nitrosocaldus sp.]|nr:aldo/keto reductase [Candidatus Nitrosocaldus sp.]MDW8000393.1 aldo/keto reductase [Candidatus Nitrosocaldus sp.]
MIQGNATREGTARFRARHEGRDTAIGHFKQFGEYTLTSVGMGTYLGRADDATDALIVDAVKRSIASGAMNVVDTAINYRFQKSERAVGRAMKELVEEGKCRRDEVFISTKNGYLTHDADMSMDFWEYIHAQLIKPGIITAQDISSGYNCIKVSYLEDQLRRSLRNMQLECIDLIYLHNAAEEQLHDVGMEVFMRMLRDAFEFYEEKRREGIIRYYGMATWDCFRVEQGSSVHISMKDVVDTARRVAGEEHGFRFIQMPFNIAMSEAATLKNQIIDGRAYTPMEAAGLLGISIFTSVPLLQGRLLNSNSIMSLIKAVKAETPALACLQFTRSSRAIPLVGQKRREHVEENLRIARIPPLSSDEFSSILATLARAA